MKTTRDQISQSSIILIMRMSASAALSRPTLAHSPFLKQRRSSTLETRPSARRVTLTKYKHALDQGFGFLHIIFETTGQMHHETLSFITCLEQASRVRQIPFAVLWKYWMSTLMFTLQRSMAQGIIRRALRSTGEDSRFFFLTV